MDENTRRQMTWVAVIAALLSLFIMAGGRRGEIARLRLELAVGGPAQRVAAVQRLVETQKLAEAVANQPRWIQDNAVAAVGQIGSEKAIFQLMTCWTVVDAPVQPRIQTTIARLGALAIPPLVEAMTDKDAKVRAGAPGVLTAIGEPTIPYLLPLMGAWDDYIRTGVATVFGGVGKPVCPDLVKIVERTDPLAEQDPAEFNRERECAVTSLLNMKINALDALTGSLLVSKNPEVRGQAATMLGTIGSGVKPEEAPQFIPPLLKAASDENWAVRRKASSALGALGQFALIGNVAPTLMQRLGDTRVEVRAAAAESLGKIEAPGVRETAAKTVETLAAAAAPPAAPGAPGAPGAAPAVAAPAVAAPAPDPKAYRAAEAQASASKMAGMLIANQSGASRELSVALIRIGPMSVGPLKGALKSGNAEVRLLATQTIAEIGGPDAITYLAAALRDASSAPVREVASDALRNAAPESLQGAAASVIPALAAALTDQQWQVYYAARDALAKIGAPAVPSLVKALASGDTRVGHMAEMALTRIGAPAVPGLVQALLTGNERVVNWASISLGEISEPAVPALTSVIASGAASANARAAAAKALGATGMLAALEPLKKAAGAPEANVRAAALKGIVALGDAGGTASLVAGISDADRGVRDTALQLLKNWRQDPVQDLLKKTIAGADVDAKRRAAIALVFETSSVTNQLLRQVASATAKAQEEKDATVEQPLTEAAMDTAAPANVRRDAITALGYIGTPNTINSLKSLLQPNNAMALPAAQAIAMVGVRESASLGVGVQDKLGEAGKMLLGLVLKPQSPELGLAAAVALSHMEDLPVDQLIEQLAGNTDENSKIWSAAVLAAIGKPATEKTLRMRGASKDMIQRQWLASTLQIIGDAMALQLMKHLPDNERPQEDQIRAIQAKVDEIRKAESL